MMIMIHFQSYIHTYIIDSIPAVMICILGLELGCFLVVHPFVSLLVDSCQEVMLMLGCWII